MNASTSHLSPLTSHPPGDPRLIVTRIHGTGRLRLSVLVQGRVTETITAANAELLLDYLWAEWPVGTTIRWIVLGRNDRKKRHYA